MISPLKRGVGVYHAKAWGCVKKHKMKTIFSSIGIAQLVIQLINFIKWIDRKTETKLYHSDSLKQLSTADEYLKNH